MRRQRREPVATCNVLARTTQSARLKKSAPLSKPHPLFFARPSCQMSLQAEPEWAGHVVNYPGCGTRIQVPQATPTASAGSAPALAEFTVTKMEQPPVAPPPDPTKPVIPPPKKTLDLFQLEMAPCPHLIRAAKWQDFQACVRVNCGASPTNQPNTRPMKNLIIILTAAIAIGTSGCATKKADTCSAGSCCSADKTAKKK